MEAKDLFPFRISLIRGDTPLPFDAYLRIGTNFVLFCKTGGAFEEERLVRLKEKNLQRLYAKYSQKKFFEQYLNGNLNRAFENGSNLELKERSHLIQGVMQATTEDLFDDIQSKDFYKKTCKAVSQFHNFLGQHPEALAYFLETENTQGLVSQHCVNVCAIALSLTHSLKNINFKDGDQLNLGVGCLLHDIGHYAMAFDFAKSVKSLSPIEQKIYKSHPTTGYEFLKPLDHVDERVKRIVYSHEEHTDGTGFPQGLNEKKLSPLIGIASVANAYDRLVTIESHSHKDALKKLLIDQMGQQPLDQLKGLQELLKKIGVI